MAIKLETQAILDALGHGVLIFASVVIPPA